MALPDLFAQYSPPQPPQPKSTGNKFQDIISRPEVLAFMLQSAATMLAQRGVGEGIASGVNAMGRYGALEGERRKDEEEEARRRFESDRSYNLQLAQYMRAGAGGGGGGGGGGGSGTSGSGVPIDGKGFAKMLYDQAKAEWDAKVENAMPGEDPGPPPDRLDYEIKGNEVAMALSNGMPLSTYQDFRRNGRSDLADSYAGIWSRDPEEGKRVTRNLGQTPENVEQVPPADPMAAPGMAPPAPRDGLPIALPPIGGFETPAIPGMPPLTPTPPPQAPVNDWYQGLKGLFK
jgi:hypothetical protein